MESHLVEFNKIEWISPIEGLRYKYYQKEDTIIRLMELSDTYLDSDWCMHGHVAYIIEGEFSVK